MYLIEPGNVSSNVYLDEAYEKWKQEKMRQDIYIISKDWGIDEVIFEKPEKQQGPNQLMHNMALHKALPELILKVKRKYTS